MIGTSPNAMFRRVAPDILFGSQFSPVIAPMIVLVQSIKKGPALGNFTARVKYNEQTNRVLHYGF